MTPQIPSRVCKATKAIPSPFQTKTTAAAAASNPATGAITASAPFVVDVVGDAVGDVGAGAVVVFARGTKQRQYY